MSYSLPELCSSCVSYGLSAAFFYHDPVRETFVAGDCSGETLLRRIPTNGQVTCTQVQDYLSWMSQLAQELVDLVVAQVDDRDLLSNTALISRSWRLSSQAKQFRSFRISHPSCLPRLAGILTSPRICALVKELHVGRWSQSSPHQLITGLQDLTRETRLTRMVNVVQVTLAGLTLDTAHESFFVTHFVAPFPLLSSLCIHHCIVSATFLPRILNSRPSLHTVSLGDCRDEHPTSEDVDALPHLCRLKTLDCDDMAPNAASALARCTPAFTALTALHMSLRLSERPAVCITAAILEAAKNSIEEFHLLAGSVPPNDGMPLSRDSIFVQFPLTPWSFQLQRIFPLAPCLQCSAFLSQPVSRISLALYHKQLRTHS